MGKQAFLVDDSRSARIVLSRLLKKNGFDEVEMAESGEQALDQLQNLQPDAIFVDFLMDGMDGLETISALKKDTRFANTPVVMCTANEGDRYLQAAIEHGALGILAKPPTQDVVNITFDVVRGYCSVIRPEGNPDLSWEPLRAEAAAFAQASPDAGAVLAVAPELEAELLALRLLSGLGYGLLRPLLKGSSAMGSLMRRKLEPVLTPLVHELNLLRGRAQ